MKAWHLVPGTLDYVSECGRLVAIYVGSFSGHAEYRVFPAGLPKKARTLRAALGVGGLPDAHVTARILSLNAMQS